MRTTFEDRVLKLAFGDRGITDHRGTDPLAEHPGLGTRLTYPRPPEPRVAISDPDDPIGAAVRAYDHRVRIIRAAAFVPAPKIPTRIREGDGDDPIDVAVIDHIKAARRAQAR